VLAIGREEFKSRKPWKYLTMRETITPSEPTLEINSSRSLIGDSTEKRNGLLGSLNMILKGD
jgi:hypothetical protein